MVLRTNRKVTAEDVKGAAAEGLSGAEIADRLGISRQRVFQIARDHGIKVRRAIRNRRNGPQRILPPRVVTGGVNLTENKVAIGTVSELLVAADLLARGWRVYIPLVRNRGYDLIAYADDIFLTVEVRSGKRSANGGVCYSPHMRRDKPSHFAVVLTGEQVRYEPDIPEVLSARS